MAEYSKEDKQAFRLKDYLNSRMSAVKAASVIFEGKAIDFSQFQEFSDSVLNWLWQGQGEIPKPLFQEQTPPQIRKEAPVDVVIDGPPAPQLSQLNILNLIAAKLDRPEKEIRASVHKWCKDNYGVDYPQKPMAVNLFCEWFQKN